MNGIGQANTTKKFGIQEKITHISQAIVALHVTIDNLVKKLEPVSIRPTSEISGTDEATDHPDMSPMEYTLMERARGIRNAATRLEDVINRLEI